MDNAESYVRAHDDLRAVGLRRPYAVLAFGGWIDASFAATNAVRYLVGQLSAREVAELDPEPFYNFTDTRPRVFTRGAGERELRWRRARWYTARLADDAEHDLILFIAPEPNLRWRTFTNVMLDVLQQLGTETIMTLGSVLASQHHRSRVPLRGWATTRPWREALHTRRVGRGRYEGPTGIATVLLVAARERGLPAVNLSAFSPTYLGHVANPRVSLALLRMVADLTALTLPLADLQGAAHSFDEQIDAFLAGQPELRAEVDRLAQLAEEPEPPQEESTTPADPDPGPLPSSGALLRDLEDFLKNLRRGEGGESSTS